jgi:hypothetical protein
MNLSQSRLVRRAFGLAFATLLVGGGLASASTAPAGDDIDIDVSFRDQPGLAVLCVYPEGSNPLQIDNFRIKGPRVKWLEDHPLNTGSVGWRVIVYTAPTKDGPYTRDSRTAIQHLDAVRSEYRSFRNRTVAFEDRSARQWVRIVSKIFFYEEDGGVRTWVRHTYTRYGLAVNEGSMPDFGDQSVVRNEQCPNLWRA